MKVKFPFRKRKRRTHEVSSVFLTNIITCNKTNPDGTVVNIREDNAEYARERANGIKL